MLGAQLQGLDYLLEGDVVLGGIVPDEPEPATPKLGSDTLVRSTRVLTKKPTGFGRTILAPAIGLPGDVLTAKRESSATSQRGGP